MNLRRCLRIAERLQPPFEQHTGIAIDLQRMVSDGSYALDVLTVCEAEPEGPLAALARQFRLALAEPPSDEALKSPAADTTSTAGWDADSTGFGASRNPSSTHSAFDEARRAARAARQSPGWMSPARWLGTDS